MDREDRQDARFNRLAELAVELRLATQAIAERALAGCLQGEAADPAEWLEREGVITASQRELLERRAVEGLLAADDLLDLTATALGLPEVHSVAGSTVPNRMTRDPRDGEPAPLVQEPGGEAFARESPGRYTIRYLHASGGQARILLAHDNHLGRDVALKELSPEDQRPDTGSGSSAEMRRLLREARVTGQLEHPNIVPVYDLGSRKDGSLYYTMRFVRGVTLSQRLKSCKSLRERLHLLRPFLDLCSAVAYAHSRGVIHRDLKPSNAMVGEFGETVLLDWGIAKVRGRREIRSDPAESIVVDEDGQVQTMAGAAIGTPGYMSPEQALGDIEQIDERSDVWGLGAMLYQILTGRAPNAARGEAAAMLAAGEQRVVPVRKLCPEAPPELAAIAEKALQRDKGRRYESAKQLGDEVEAYLVGGRVGAYRYSSWELLTRFAQQNKRAMAAAGLILLVIIGALIAVTISYGRERHARRDQAAARHQENQERLVASFNLAGAYYQRAERQKADSRFISAAGYAAQSLLLNPVHPRSPRFNAEFAAAHPDGRELATLAASTVYQTRFHEITELAHIFEAKEVLSQAAFSSDGTMIAAGGYDRAVYLWDPDTRQLLRQLVGHRDRVTAVAFSPEGPMLVSGSRDGQVLVWNAASGQRLHELPGSTHIRTLAFSPDGTLLAAAGRDRLIRLWRPATGELVAELAGNEDEVFAVAFSPDGERLAAAGDDRRLRLWSLKTRRVEATFDIHSGRISALAFSPDGRSLASAGGEKTVHVMAVATGRPTFVLEGHGDAISGLAWSSDGRFIATSSIDETASLWDARSGGRLVTLEGHTGFVNGVAFSARGDRLLTVGNDRTVRMWRLKRDAERTALVGHAQSIYGLAFSPDGRRIATASWDRTVRLWETESRRQLFALRQGARVDRLAFAPDGVLLASCSKDRKVRVWDAREGALFFEREVPQEPAGIAFSPDGRTLAVAAGDAVRLFDVRSRGRDVRVLQGHEKNVTDVTFSPDGRQLATSGQDRLVLLWDLASGKVLRTLSGHEDWVWSVRFSADGQRLVSAGRDGVAIIWAPGTGAREQTLVGHQQWVNAAQFSADGRLVATGSDDKTARIWDAATGAQLLVFDATREVAGLAFSPDPRLLAVADGNSVMLYPIDFSVSAADPVQLLGDAERAGFQPEGFGAAPGR